MPALPLQIMVPWSYLNFTGGTMVTTKRRRKSYAIRIEFLNILKMQTAQEA